MAPVSLTARVALVAGVSAASPGPSVEPGPRCRASLAELGVAITDPRWAAPELLVLDKAGRSLQHFQRGVARRDEAGALACWRVGLGFSPEGPKEREGDGRTPEGWYRTSDKPDSSFADAILVHYPNADDAARGQAAGRITAATAATLRSAEASARRPDQNTALGGQILLHGGGSSTDWTLGCAALDDDDLRALRAGLPASKRAWLRVLP